MLQSLKKKVTYWVLLIWSIKSLIIGGGIFLGFEHTPVIEWIPVLEWIEPVIIPFLIFWSGVLSWVLFAKVCKKW